jgi:hypothetical protein
MKTEEQIRDNIRDLEIDQQAFSNDSLEWLGLEFCIKALRSVLE